MLADGRVVGWMDGGTNLDWSAGVLQPVLMRRERDRRRYRHSVFPGQSAPRNRAALGIPRDFARSALASTATTVIFVGTSGQLMRLLLIFLS